MLRKSALLSAALLGALSNAEAQPAVRHDPQRNQWYLQVGESSYVVGINERQMLQTLYWGPRLPSEAALPEGRSEPGRIQFDPSINTTPMEYPAWGGGLYYEPALKLNSPNGDRTLILVYDSATIHGSTLEIILRDTVQQIKVHLFYQVFPEGILGRWSRIDNVGTQPVHLEQAASAIWNLPGEKDYSLSWLTGQWAGEWQLHTAPLGVGAQILESRRGSTGHQANPWFAIGRTGKTTETDGPVWFGELGWSGSWRMSIERTSLDLVRITAGYNPFDFAWKLAPGASFETPKFYAGYTSQGQGQASRILHRFQLQQILPGHPNVAPRPIIFNSWEATEFDVNESGQIALADKAAKIGVERFTVDDGWFGQRTDDHAGLGDWYVNKTKFPHGLKPLIDHVHSLGMSFGLWVEPEMVNPNSDLYRAHPDWVLNFPDRERTEGRNQLVLNLARADVKSYVFNFLDKLLIENDIAFLKWDYNRNWSEPGWPELSASAESSAFDSVTQKEVYVRYVENLYDILAMLRARHPHLQIESCSGGGGRVDLGILRYTDEVWPSDNTDGLDRLSIQDGFTHAYAPQIMPSWVTDVPNFLNHRIIPLQFRFLSAMQGALGIGVNLNKLTPEELKLATDLTAFYKTIRTTVQQGNLYRLQAPGGNSSSAVQYVSQSGAQVVLLAYLRSQSYGMAQPRIRLEGLDSKAIYRVHALDPLKYDGEAIVSGAALMGRGVLLKLVGDYDSTALEVKLVR